MSNLRQAAQQALEALEEMWQSDKAQVAITALRAALAEPEQNPFGDDAERYARKLHEEREYYKALFTAPTPRRPLTDEDIFHEAMAIITRIQKDDWVATDQDIIEFARTIERAHGIGEQT